MGAQRTKSRASEIYRHAACRGLLSLRNEDAVPLGPRIILAIVGDPFGVKFIKHGQTIVMVLAICKQHFGLVPSQDQSGSTNRLGRITRDGSATVRHLLVEAAWQSARRSPTVKAFLERVQRGDPERKKKAVVATAHYLVRVMWAMMKHGTLWRETKSVQAA